METTSPRPDSRTRLTLGVAAALFAGAAALGLSVAPPAAAAIDMSPDILRGLCKNAGGNYIETPDSYKCENLAGGATVYCPMGVKTSRGCQVWHAKGTSQPPLPGFPPNPEANAPDQPAPSPPAGQGSQRPSTGGVG